jgi:hypothetical protein
MNQHDRQVLKNEKRKREFHKQEERMVGQTYLAGTFALTGTSITLNRMGFGAMQLAGPQVWGPPQISTQSDEHGKLITGESDP